jgi:D-glycero-alpha-D-manno-heptose-7-phosphate kinase
MRATTPVDIRGVLHERSVIASAPCRLDCGGTLDLPPLALQLEKSEPSTVTIAISLRTTATLRAGVNDTVIVESSSIGREEMAVESLPLTGPFALVNAIIHHFCITGFQLVLHSDVPLGSGLGGSGVVAVVVIAAICAALSQGTEPRMLDYFWIARLAHQLENSVAASLTGFQDQLAAVFGGVNMWTWRYSDRKRPYIRQVLLRKCDLPFLSKRIAVAFTGEQRRSTPVSAQYIRDYFAGRTRREWMEVSRWVSAFAEALKDKDCGGAWRALNEEMRIRDQMCPGLWPGSALALRATAERNGCTARTGGGNWAGCIWSFGEPEAITALREDWGKANLPAEVVSGGIEVKSVTGCDAAALMSGRKQHRFGKC